MRDILLTAIFFGVLPFAISRPYIGIYIWCWLGFMNPHRLTYGFAYDFPFAQIIAIVIFGSMLKLRVPVRVPWTRETVLLLIFVLWMLFTTFFAMNTDGAWNQWDKVWKIQLMLFVMLMLGNCAFFGIVWSERWHLYDYYWWSIQRAGTGGVIYRG